MASRLTIALGIGKKKGKGSPPPYNYKKPAEKTPEEKTPAVTIAAPPEEAVETPTESVGEDSSLGGLPGAMDDSVGESGIGPADVDYSDNDLCETCANMGQDGNCTKYNFPVQPTGHCEAGYTPQAGGGLEGTLPESTGTVGDQPPIL